MKKLILVLLVVSAMSVGCTDAERKNITTWGDSAVVKLYSGGVLVGSWVSTGKVAATEQSDGWELVDKATGKFIRVSGDVVITN